MVYITHDQEEAFAMADRITVMELSRLIQIDTPMNIIKNPANDYVRDFEKIEFLNIITGSLIPPAVCLNKKSQKSTAKISHASLAHILSELCHATVRAKGTEKRKEMQKQ